MNNATLEASLASSRIPLGDKTNQLPNNHNSGIIKSPKRNHSEFLTNLTIEEDEPPRETKKLRSESLMLTEFASKKLKPNYFLEEDTETLRNWLIERQEMYFCDPNYMSSQPFFNTRMRTTLIDWLIEVGETYSLWRETIHITVNFIDRYFSLEPQIQRENLQLVSIGALHLASKLEEFRHFEAKTLVDLTDNAYTVAQLNNMERIIAQKLKWKLLPVTSYTWFKFYVDILFKKLQISSLPKTELSMASQVLDNALLDITSLQFDNSFLGAGAFYYFCTLCYVSEYSTDQDFPSLFLDCTTYTLDQISPCVNWFKVLIQSNHLPPHLKVVSQKMEDEEYWERIYRSPEASQLVKQKLKKEATILEN